MNKSKIILAIAAGAVIGGAIALTIKHNNQTTEEDDEKLSNTEPSKLENIAQQFADKISVELETAERKIKSAVSKEMNRLNPESELGLFL
jgi:peptidoglycan hydrolase CwlO-like protein